MQRGNPNMRARTHDTQCVIYQGPDAEHPNNPEICGSTRSGLSAKFISS
jgi:hypothetical protein